MLKALIVIAALVGQTRGGPGLNNVQEVHCIQDSYIVVGIPASALGVSPGSEPNWFAVPAGQDTYQRCFADNADQFLVFTLKTISQYKEGGDIPVAVQWSPYTTDLGDVSWDLQCSGPIAVDAAWPNPTSYTALSAGRGTLYQLTAESLGTISGTGVTVSGGLDCSIFRRASSDPADDFNGLACLAGITFAFPIDSIGQQTTTTKGWPCAAP